VVEFCWAGKWSICLITLPSLAVTKHAPDQWRCYQTKNHLAVAFRCLPGNYPQLWTGFLIQFLILIAGNPTVLMSKITSRAEAYEGGRVKNQRLGSVWLNQSHQTKSRGKKDDSPISHATLHSPGRQHLLSVEKLLSLTASQFYLSNEPIGLCILLPSVSMLWHCHVARPYNFDKGARLRECMGGDRSAMTLDSGLALSFWAKSFECAW